MRDNSVVFVVISKVYLVEKGKNASDFGIRSDEARNLKYRSPFVRC